MTIKECAAKGTLKKVARLVSEIDIPGRGRLLDIPCGEGAFFALPELSRYDLYGCDIQNILKTGKARFPGGNMEERLPYEDSFFDVIACIDEIEHIRNPFSFIKECHRLLNTGGSLIISTPNLSSLRSRWRFFLTSHHNKGKAPLNENQVSPYHHINLLTLHELRYMLHTQGFRIIRITCNRKKAISLPYLLFWPVTYAMTWLVYHKELSTPVERKIGEELLKESHRLSVFCGETIIVRAQKRVGS